MCLDLMWFARCWNMCGDMCGGIQTSPSVCAALCGMEVPAHTQGLPHIPGQISRTPRFLPHAHIPHISPKPRTHGAPRRTYPAGRPHIPPNLRTYPPRPRVNMEICLHAHIPEVPAHIPPYGGRFWVHRGEGSRRPSQSPLEGHGPHLGGRGYVRICAGICADHKNFRF